MEKDKITAEWAKKTATQILGLKAKEQIDRCLDSIRVAVSNNHMSTGLSIKLHDIAKIELETRGFKIESSSDQRDGDWTTISW